MRRHLFIVVLLFGMQFGADLALNDLDGTALASSDWVPMSPFAQPMRWRTLRLTAANGVGGGGVPDDPGITAGHDGAAGGCGVGGSSPAPWALLLPSLLLWVRRFRDAD